MFLSIRRKFEESIISDDVRASALVPVLSYSEDDHIFLMDDKSIGIGFECIPLYGADEKMQERANSFINQDFPAQTMIQFTLFRSPDVVAQMNHMLAMRDNYRHPVFTQVIEERADFMLKHTHEKLVSKSSRGVYDNGYVQDLKLIITVKIPIRKNQPSSREIKEMLEIQNKVESSLQSIGLAPRALTARNYIRIMNTMVNWGANPSWRAGPTKWETDKPISEQIFDYDTDIEVTRDGMRLGDQHIRMLSAKRLPESMYFGDAILYAGDLMGGNSSVKENYMVTCNVFFPDTEKTKASIERKRQFTVNQAYGPLLKFVPILADKKKSFDIVYESVNNGFRPVRISYGVTLFAPTKDRADAAVTAARSVWREQRFELMHDRFATLPMFINSLPFCVDNHAVRDLFRYKTMTAEQAAVLLPLFGEWKGTGTPHAALISRNGQAMSLSLHDSDTNMNLVIAAESGSGKSFLTNELIFSYLSEGAQVWVIDAGRSYMKLAELLKGDFVHFEEGAGVCLNPFQLIIDYEDEEDAIVSIVSTMASAKGNLDEWQVSALKQTMSLCWAEKGKDMTIDDIAELCQRSPDQRLRDVGQQLYVFTKSGGYGRYFSGENNVNFKNQFTVLELDELQGRKHLRQVVLLQLIYQIQQEVFLGERDRKKIVIVDEAWDLLKDGEVSVFMEHAYRKFRKYGGSVIIATQSVNDLYENAVGRAIAENSSSMYLLGQTAETIESVKRSGRLALSESGFHMLKTVHTVQGVYSEIFVKAKSGWGIGRLIVGEFQKLLYSTKAEDVNDIDRYVRNDYTIPEAIRQVLRDRGVSDYILPNPNDILDHAGEGND